MAFSKAQLKEIIDNPASSMLELMIASIVSKGVQGGDHYRLNFLLDRVVGKVKEEVEISTIKPTVIEKSDGSTVILGLTTEGEE